jgi:hypothetical protein
MTNGKSIQMKFEANDSYEYKQSDSRFDFLASARKAVAFKNKAAETFSNWSKNCFM